MFLSTDVNRKERFSRVPTISKSRNAFSEVQSAKGTMQFDKLYPLYWKYIYPGDTLSITQHIMMRLGTQVSTLYDDLYIDVHAWFVPNRLTQTNWARYQFNAQPLGPTQDNSSLTAPTLDLSGLTTGFGSKSLYDVFGKFGDPTVDLSSSVANINNYLGRSYNLIWNTNYRDQNLQEDIPVDLDEGPDDPADYVLKARGKRHDMFTSCLTAQQKGTAPTLSLGSTIPIIAKNEVVQWQTSNDSTSRVGYINSDGTLDLTSNPTAGNMKFADSNSTGLLGDVSAVTALTVNAMRTQISIQHLLEADARSGTRDVEAISARWGVEVPDFRLQRPEYIGGSTFDFNGNVVPQTSETGTTPQGNLVQFSESLGSFNVNHSFVEHGVFMILVSTRSNLTYQQSLARELSYNTRYDWFQPEFANLGEVGVKNKEIMFQGTGAGGADDDDFGFQEYGYELRYSNSYVFGEMRSNFATPLDNLHMADDYSSLPTLNAAFIESQTPIDRNLVNNPSTVDPIEVSTIVKGKIARTLPMFSIPGLLRL